MWATADEVTATTGVTVTAATLAAANDDICMHSGVLDDANVYTRDEEWLAKAVCWQAAWLHGQPGHAERSSVTSVSQDGLSATYLDATAVVLAPRARRCLKNLSWMGPRSLRMTARGATGHLNTNPDFEPTDRDWVPI